MSYWDGGYVQLDVTDPTVAEARILSDTDFAARRPGATSRGLTPEGNAHQAEFTRDNQVLRRHGRGLRPVPRGRATITGGPYAGTEFTAVQAGDAKPIDDQTTVDGPTSSSVWPARRAFPAAAEPARRSR